MSFFNGWRAVYLYGKAIAKFHRHQYDDSARLLEKVRQLDTQPERGELYDAYLGRSYLALGSLGAALTALTRTYEPFCKQSLHFTEDDERDDFIIYLAAFSEVLRKVNQTDKAEEIARQAEEYRNA